MHDFVSPLVDDTQGTVVALHPGLSVVEGFHGPEAGFIEWTTQHINVIPASGVGSPGVSLVKYVQVAEPFAVQQPAVGVDMGVIAGIILHHGVAVPEVPGVPVAFPVGRGPVGGDVKIAARVIPHRAPAFLEIAAPGVAFHVEWSAVRPNVMPAAG